MSVQLRQESTVAYPQKFLSGLYKEIATVREKIKCGEQPIFDNVDALFEKLESGE